MSLAYAVSDAQVMVIRSTRRSLRDPEAFFTALMLPIVLMLLFVYVFGGALNTGGKYADYVVPGLIVLCAGFGAGTTAVAVATDMANGIVDRFRSMPIASSSILIGHIAASLARNLIATTLVIGVGLGVGWRPAASPAGWTAAAGMIVLFILALSWLAAAVGLLARSAEAANSLSLRADVHSLREHRVRARPHPARAAALDRRAPAVHPGRRDHARPVDGAHLYRRGHRPRGLDRDRVVCGHPGYRRHQRILAVPAPEQRLRASHITTTACAARGLSPAGRVLGCRGRSRGSSTPRHAYAENSSRAAILAAELRIGGRTASLRPPAGVCRYQTARTRGRP